MFPPQNVVFCLLVLINSSVRFSHALSSVFPREGCGATPLQKKRVGVLGGAGYLGALTYGFLQRSAQLYGTGIGSCRCMGATADTAVRLNRFLGMHFCLAFADESTIQLTDLMSVEVIQTRLEKMDALIMGTSNAVRTRSVVPATYEKTPNDKAWEIYWDTGAVTFPDDGPILVREEILQNVLQAAKLAKLRHIVVVDSDGAIEAKLKEIGVPYTCICTGNTELLTTTPAFSFKDGVRATPAIRTAPASSDELLCREDLAALCVQVLQTLSWEKSRTIHVSNSGPAGEPRSTKRIDQQWCVNSEILEGSLKNMVGA